MAPVPSRCGRIKGHGRRWPPPWFSEGQNIAGFIQRRHRIVVARQYHQLAAGLLKLNHKAVIQLASVAWRRAGIKDVAGDNNGIDLVRLRAGQQPVEKGRVFGGAALAVKFWPRCQSEVWMMRISIPWRKAWAHYIPVIRQVAPLTPAGSIVTPCHYSKSAII